MKITVFQHHPADAPGTIELWAKERSISLEIVDPTQAALNSNIIADALIVLGGPMGTYEEEKFPWLRTEKKVIRDIIDSGKKVLGICLGAQLIADCLGARVYPHSQKEIGWFPVEKTPEGKNVPVVDAIPSVSNVLHWHGDTFDLPRGAISLFKTAVCENQGFLFKQNALAFQFHPEADRHWAENIVAHLRHELKDLPFVQSEKAILAQLEKCDALRAPFFATLDNFFNGS